MLTGSRQVPSAVLIAVDTEETRDRAAGVAQALRARGIPCEVAPRADKYGKQIEVIVHSIPIIRSSSRIGAVVEAP